MTQSKNSVLSKILDDYKHQIIGGVVIVVLAVVAFLVWQQAIRLFALRTVPILTEDTNFLIALKSQNDLIEESEMVGHILNQMIQINPDDTVYFLNKLPSLDVRQYGLISRGDDYYWFAQTGSTSDLELGQDLIISHDKTLSIPWVHSFYQYEGGDYHFWGTDEWVHDPTSDESQFLQEKKVFSELISQYDASIIWPSPFGSGQKDSSIVFGSIYKEAGVVRTDLSATPSLIGSNLEIKEIPNASFYLEAKEWPSDKINSLVIESIFDVEKIHSLFLNVMPGKLIIRNASLQSFLENPFVKEVEWSISTDKSNTDALDLLKGVVEEFSHEYPQVEEKVLPDDSTVFELVQETSPFEDPVIGEDLPEKGLITYPLDQISYKYSSGELSMAKSYDDPSTTVENSCVGSQNKLFGTMISGDESNGVWKKLDFSYSQGYLVLCFT